MLACHATCVCAAGGVLANSLALFTDVLHLASDLISYVISLLALYLARKPATRRLTFGYHRAGESVAPLWHLPLSARPACR